MSGSKGDDAKLLQVSPLIAQISDCTGPYRAQVTCESLRDFSWEPGRSWLQNLPHGAHTEAREPLYLGLLIEPEQNKDIWCDEIRLPRLRCQSASYLFWRFK